MSETDPINNQPPKFQIVAPNPLIGNRVIVIMNPAMRRSLCELFEDLDLNPEEDAHLCAFRGELRRYGQGISKMYGRTETKEEPREEPVEEPVRMA